jgi:diguanylate cyclase (GGDEF)-like protein
MMTRPTPLPSRHDTLIDDIDRGIESHLAWNHRLLRFSLLRGQPGDEILAPHGHQLCQLGLWLARIRNELAAFDPALTQAIFAAHEAMHLAVRQLCLRTLQGQPAELADFDAYEQSQNLMVARLHTLRQLIVEASMQHDVLTGLPLRHGVEHAFRQRHEDALRTQRTLWIAMIDADHFKQVNDTHGHAVGDLALRHLAQCMVASLREQDILLRFGGEEFLAMLLTPPGLGVEVAAQRLLDAVRTKPLPLDSGGTLVLGVTIGLARVQATEPLASAIARADQALLLGKAQGRNRYVLAPG